MSEHVGLGVDVGLAYRGDEVKVVRLVGDHQFDVFSAPAKIPGVPTKLDYAIDPGPAVESETHAPGQFTLVAFGSDGKTQYRTTWLFTWQGTRFTISAPQTVKTQVDPCAVCDAAG